MLSDAKRGRLRAMVASIRCGVASLAALGLCALLMIGSMATPVQAQRQGRFFEEVVTSGDSSNDFNVWHGNTSSQGEEGVVIGPINWTHSLSPSDIAAANSGGVIVDAYDVDYPSATEHDNLVINGSNYGLLEGRNNGWGTTERSISVSHLHSGSNAFRVDPDELDQGWILRIRRSTLYLYANEDFDISATPTSQSVDATDTTTYLVQIDWIGVWDNPVDLSVAGLPAGATAAFSPHPVTVDGGNSTMTVTLSNVAPGTYPLNITGQGTADYEDSSGSRNVAHLTQVNLIVGEGDEDPPDEDPPSGFQLITANPDYIELEPGQTVESKIFGHFTGSCQGPISIDIIGSRFVMDATSGSQFNRTDKPEMIKARLLRTELAPAYRGATLEMRAGREMAIGEYDVVVSGAGCGIEDQQVKVTLAIKAADLKISKYQSQSTVKPNMVQIYTIRVTNEGKASATDVVVTDTLSSELTYVSDTASDAVHSEKNGQHRWAFSKPLRPGASFSFNINARVDPFIRSGVSISNRAEVIADMVPQPILSNTVTAVSGFEAVQPDGLKVSKRAFKRDARIGGILTYRIEVENSSSAGPIFDVDLIDRMPNGFIIPDGKTLRDGSIFANPQRKGRRTYSWRLGNLGPGQRTVLTYQTVVGTNADSGRNENTATATGVDGGGNRVSGSDSALVMLGVGDIEEPSEINVTVLGDNNRNERLDATDKPLEGIEVLLVPPGLKQETDEEGETLYAEMISGQYIVAVNELKLAEDVHVLGEASQLVRLIEGESADIQFLLTTEPRYGKLIARVYLDTNKNERFDDDERTVQEYTAILDKKIKSQGKNGMVIFSRLEPGNHNLIIQAGGKEVSREVTIQPGRNEVDIPIIESRLNIRIRQSGG